VTTWGWRARSIVKWVIIAVVVLVAAALFVLAGYFIVGPRASVTVRTQYLKVGDCIQEWSGRDVLPQVTERRVATAPISGRCSPS